MRNSNLLKWAQSKQNDKTGNRNWIHPPDALQKGHIAYLVKFMGNTEVDQPKGIEVVKEGIRKLKFNQQLKKSEGTKIPKVELTISIDGVAIQEPKTNRIMHQYPLHRISYCADDKGEKKFFSFIAKEGPDSERHMCFVFVSDKLAEEITLTIGQAFDLAYKRFLETSGKELEVQRRVMLLQQRVNQLETESTVLRQRLSDVLNGHASDLMGYMKKNKITNMLVVDEAKTEAANNNNNSNGISMNGSSTPETNGGLLLNLNETPPASLVPPVPPRSFERNSFINDTPSVGTKLEGLLLDDLEDDFNPRAFENTSSSQQQQQLPPPFAPLPSTAPGLTLGQTLFGGNNNGVTTNGTLMASSQPTPLLAPPPRSAGGMSMGRGERGGAVSGGGGGGGGGFTNKASSPATDPFGMDDFGSNNLESAIGLLDKKILEMKDGFSRGLTFGNEDFSIESLDPLRK